MSDKRNGKLIPILTMRAFELEHLRREQQLKAYMTTKRGRNALDDATAETLKDSAALSLKANSTLARIEFARTLSDRVAKFLPAQPTARFITYAPPTFATPIVDAPRFDVSKLAEWGRERMKGRNYIAIIEPALYTNYPAQFFGEKGAVSWHFHALDWSDDPAEELYIEIVADPHDTFVPGVEMIHVRDVKGAEEICGRAIYMSKAPLREYRVYAAMETVEDRLTGEQFKKPTGRYKQKKRALRPGDASSLCRIIGSRELGDLTFGGGEGVELLKKVLNKTKDTVEEIYRARFPQQGYFSGLSLKKSE